MLKQCALMIFHVVVASSGYNPMEYPLVKKTSGDTIRLECNRTVEGTVDWKVEYDPRYTPTYICIKGRLLDKFKPRFELDPYSYTLTIHDVMVNDTGVYYCVDDEGFGQPHFTRLDVVLLPPGQLSLVNRTETSLTIRFNQTGRVTGYNVSVNGRLTTDVTYSGIGEDVVNATVHNLTPGSRHSVSVWSSRNGEYCKTPTTASYSTVPAAPGPLSLVNRTEECLTISWNQIGRVTNYTVTIDNGCPHNAEYFGVGTEFVTVELCCLWIETTYKVSVTAVSDDDTSQATSGDFKTPQRPSSVPVVTVVIVAVVPTVIVMVVLLTVYLIYRRLPKAGARKRTLVNQDFTTEHKRFLDFNQSGLSEVIAVRSNELLDRLKQNRWITGVERRRIKNISSDREAEILRLFAALKHSRCREFNTFIRCLQKSGHQHIASAIAAGEGVLVKIGITCRVENIWSDVATTVVNTFNYEKHGSFENDTSVVGISNLTSQCFRAYFHCKTIMGLHRLDECYITGELEIHLRDLICKLTPDEIATFAITWEAPVYIRCVRYFHETLGLLSDVYTLFPLTEHSLESGFAVSETFIPEELNLKPTFNEGSEPTSDKRVVIMRHYVDVDKEWTSKLLELIVVKSVSLLLNEMSKHAILDTISAKIIAAVCRGWWQIITSPSPQVERLLKRMMTSRVGRVSKINNVDIDISPSPFARGTFADVYDAKWSNQDVAVKAFRSTPELDKQMRKLQLEVNRVIGIHHPNIIRLFGTTRVSKNRLGIVMEKVDNGSLDRYIYTLSRQQAVAIALGVIDGVDFMHKKNITHCRLKPQKIMLSGSQMVPIITDFGVSRVIQTVATNMSTVGTPTYVAPELLKRGSSYGCPADVFSLSVILFEMFSGQSAEGGLDTNFSVTKMSFVNGRRPTIPTGFPDDIKPLVERGWADDAERRTSLAEFRSAIEKLGVGPSTSRAPIRWMVDVSMKQQSAEMAKVNLALPLMSLEWDASCEALNSQPLRMQMVADISTKSNVAQLINESVLSVMKIVPRHLFIEGRRLPDFVGQKPDPSEQDVVNAAYFYKRPIPATMKSNESSPEIIGTQLSMTEVIPEQSVLLVGIKGGYIQSLVGQLVGFNGLVVTATSDTATMDVCRQRIDQYCPFNKIVQWVVVTDVKNHASVVEEIRRRKLLFHRVIYCGSVVVFPFELIDALYATGNSSIMAPVRSKSDNTQRFTLYQQRGNDAELRTITDFSVSFDEVR